LESLSFVGNLDYVFLIKDSGYKFPQMRFLNKRQLPGPMGTPDRPLVSLPFDSLSGGLETASAHGKVIPGRHGEKKSLRVVHRPGINL
jgi:hypothetical protein